MGFFPLSRARPQGVYNLARKTGMYTQRETGPVTQNISTHSKNCNDNLRVGSEQQGSCAGRIPEGGTRKDGTQGMSKSPTERKEEMHQFRKDSTIKRSCGRRWQNCR